MNDIKLPKIAKEGLPFILIFLAATIILFIFSKILGILGVILTVWCALFFRDPDRVTPQNDNLVIAPADGKVLKISRALPPKDLGLPEEELLKISIFMNVFNVHVNRSPMSGTIKTISYTPGKFFNASLDKASEDNERQAFILETEEKQQVIFVQIAGLVARRIVKFVEEGTKIKAGEKFGLIRFGSRVDIYLPASTVPSVIEGQTTIAGETVIANFNNTEEITGEILDKPNNAKQ